MNEELNLETEPFQGYTLFDEFELADTDLFAPQTSAEWQGEVNRTNAKYVRWVQQSLNQILSLRLTVDGNSGPQTRSAIRTFQARQRLLADGIVGPKTEAALVAAGAQNPPGVTTPSLGTPPVAPPVGVDFNVKIVAKSFINLIGSATGFTVCSPLFDSRLRALALATDSAFRENPPTDVKDKVYRLYSERTFRVSCLSGRIVKVVPSGLDTDVGPECFPGTSACLVPPALTISGIAAGSSGLNTFDFSWRAKGSPHLAAEPAFQLVCPRISRFIWHTVSGRLACGPSGINVSVNLSGSRFPSHRVWVNGRVVRDIPQRDFNNLWVPNRSDLTLVR